MSDNSEEIVLNNRSGKVFHIYLNTCLLILIFFIFNETNRIFYWPFIFTFYSAFFAFKSVKVRKEGITIVYHLRPFFREIKYPVKSIRIIRFSLFGGGKAYPNMNFTLNRYPFLFEIRLDKKDDVEDLFKLLCQEGEFKIKPLSDKRIMKIRLYEIGKNSKCTVI
jgi:hypothetical protein